MVRGRLFPILLAAACASQEGHVAVPNARAPLDPLQLPLPPCALAGSQFVANQADIDDLAGYCELTGDLEIVAPGLGVGLFPDLARVGGSIHIHDNDALTVSMPQLGSVGGTVRLDRNDGPTTVELPAAVALADLAIENNTGQLTLSAPLLGSVGEVDLRDGDSLLLDVPGLATAGALRISGSSGLVGWPFVGLISAEAIELADDTGAGRSVSMPALQNVDGLLSLDLGGSNPCELTTFDAPSWTTGGDVRVETGVFCHMTFAAPSLEVLTGSLVFYDSLLDAVDLSSLREADALVVEDSGIVGQLELPALTVLHGQLAHVAGITAPQLSVIEGDLVDVDTPGWESSYYALYVNAGCLDGRSLSAGALAEVAGQIRIENRAYDFADCGVTDAFDVDLGSLGAVDRLELLLTDPGSTANFSSLASAGTLTVEVSGGVAFPSLASAETLDLVGIAELPALTTTGGLSLVASERPGAAAVVVADFPSLAFAAHLTITAPELQSIALPQLVTVGPTDLVPGPGLSILYNDLLDTVDLDALTTVHGPLNLAFNPRWCVPDIDAVVARVSVYGDVDVFENGEDPSCGTTGVDPGDPPGVDPPDEPHGVSPPSPAEGGCGCRGHRGTAPLPAVAIAAVIARRRNRRGAAPSR
jgi:hypothetical protein